MGVQRKLGFARGPMTTMPSGVVYLLEGVIFLPLLPPLRRAFQVEALTFFGRMTTMPVTLLPHLRRRLGSSAGGGHLLSPKSFRFCICLRSFRLHRPGCIGRHLVDALPLFCSL